MKYELIKLNCKPDGTFQLNNIDFAFVYNITQRGCFSMQTFTELNYFFLLFSIIM